MILKIDNNNPDNHRVSIVVECLKNDGVIIYPTDTVYTLGCSMNSKTAYKKICQLKHINPKKANFSMVCYDLSHISEYTKNLDTPTFKLLNKLLPGPYTFILKANRSIEKLFHKKKKEIGIRIPNNNVARAIVKQLGHPILSASVKVDDDIQEYVTDPEELIEIYKNKVNIVINSGIGGDIPSTIIDCTQSPPSIIRKGLGSTNII